MTDLEQRMKLHTPGQVTWPDIGTRRKCAQCDYFTTRDVSEERRQGKGYGRCVKAHELMGKNGAQFIGATAHGCPQFRSET